ncbi:MAG: N-acetyltransferase [Planctomycetes bacterium]|nr:N-acetyltransferase [Planctomycetota bacterium]
MTAHRLEVATVDVPHRSRPFLRVPWIVHRGDPRWVEPLRHSVRRLLHPARNPFWRHARARFWLARRGGEPVGRIAAILNAAHDERWAEAAGFFGFFECVDDGAAARALLETAADWLRRKGATVLRGPCSPSTNHECGVLVEGFDRDPFVMMPYTPPHYPAALEGFGLHKAMDLLSFAIRPEDDFPPKFARVAEAAARRHGIRLRRLDPGAFAADLETLRRIYNGAWADNWGFVPVSTAEFAFLAAELRPIAWPDFILFAESAGETVAAVVCVPDLNPLLKRMNGRLFPLAFRHLLGWRRKVGAVRLLTLGVLPEFRGRGVDALLYRELLAAGRRHGFRRDCELGWVLETNAVMLHTIQHAGGRPVKRLRLYAMPL